jgi:hypothetical protein
VITFLLLFHNIGYDRCFPKVNRRAGLIEISTNFMIYKLNRRL